MALTTRPIRASPTGISAIRPVRLTGSPSLTRGIFAHQHGTNVVFFEVQRDAIESAGELQHFSGHGSVEPVDLGNPVADLDDRAGLLDIDLLVEAFDLSL